MSQMEDVCVSVNVRRYLFLERMERVQTKGAEYCELGQFTNGHVNRFDRSPNPELCKLYPSLKQFIEN